MKSFKKLDFTPNAMLSTLVLITLMPLQVSPTGKSPVPISKPLAVAAFIDSAKILGLPQLKLRDGNGNLYSPHKTMMSEPYAVVHQSAGVPMFSELTMRKAFIHSYIKR